jgi:hypothetical protein
LEDLAWLWLITAAVLLVRHWRDRSGVGLLITYVMSFGGIHWLAAAIYLLPWYPNRGADLVELGLREATYATIALAAGAEVATWLLKRRGLVTGGGTDLKDMSIDRRAVNVYFMAGAVLYGVISPLGQQLPGLQALIATGSTIVVVALGLKAWNAWQHRESSSLWTWLGLTSLMPIITVVTQGFLGYGFAAMLTVFAFVGSFYRPRWKVIAAGAVLAYLGLSVYVTYMRDRNEIRAVVWGGRAWSDRTTQLAGTLANFEWFDPEDNDHLARIDSRLNQDYLVGAAVAHLELGAVPYADGQTLTDAVLGVIPRALWPNKPSVGGSGDLVATYTGLRFADGTSVGIGQVMESYINFGTPGVITAFLIIGALLAFVDRRAGDALRGGDIRRFTLWYLPGLSLLQVGGSIVEVTSTAAAGLLMALVLNRVIRQLTKPPPEHEAALALAGSQSREARP